MIDKGTLDAVICGDESVCDPDKLSRKVDRVLSNEWNVCVYYVWNA